MGPQWQPLIRLQNEEPPGLARVPSRGKQGLVDNLNPTPTHPDTGRWKRTLRYAPGPATMLDILDGLCTQRVGATFNRLILLTLVLTTVLDDLGQQWNGNADEQEISDPVDGVGQDESSS